MKHERIGFSSYYITHKCSGHIYMKQRFPTEETDVMAWGSNYHEGVERTFRDYLYNGFSLEEAHKINTKDVHDEEMIALTLQTCQEMKAQLEAIGPKKIQKIGIEEKILLSEKLQFGGILDFCYLVNTGDQKVFVSWDHKSGKKLVEAEGNLQLIAGACAAYSSPDWGPFDRAVLHIYQPRAEHPEGPLRRMKILKEDIEEWSTKLLTQAEKVNKELENGAPTFNPGPHCDWCPGNGNCEAQLTYAQEAAGADFLPVAPQKEPQLPDPNVLTLEQKQGLVLYRKPIESFFKAVESTVLDEMNNGAEYSQLKLVRSRTRRAWTGNVEKVVQVLEGAGMKEEDTHEKKLCTLNAVTKAIGKKKAEEIFAEWTDKPEGVVQVAPLDDKRVAVEPQVQKAQKEFEDENS